MADDTVRADLVLADCAETATIHAPIELVDIADWLLHLPDREYQRCAPPAHKAAGSTTTDDGRPMSINVEEIGGSLMIQHYVAEVHEPHHCRMVSLSDLQVPGGWTKVQVIWDLRAERVDDSTCRYTNTVVGHPTQGFLDVLSSAGTTFEAAAEQQDKAVREHNGLETPHYAASIGRKALENRGAPITRDRNTPSSG